MPATIDVTGLPEGAVKALQVTVDYWKQHPSATPDEAFQHAKEMTNEEWVRLWRQMVSQMRPVRGPVDDSRESIYAGRGE